MSNQTADELMKLLDELDDESLSKMSDDDVLTLRKKLNPYGRTIEGSDKILTYSYTDLRHEYLKKIITTSIIGFLNRMCDEWKVPDGIPVIPVYDYIKNPEKLDEFEKTLDKPELMREDLDLNKKYMAKRVIIKEFLEDMFQYNPDYHVRSAYKPNVDDPERNIIDSPAGHLAIYELKKKNPEFAETWLLYNRTLDLKNIVNGQIVSEKGCTHDVIEIDNKVVSDVRQQCTEMIPPVDIFHRIQHYYDSNYEELKEIVNDLYCDKPDLETALNPYSWHDTEDQADEFINKHKDEVISNIFKAHSGKWNIFASYKKVRDSMRFFNKKTQVLEEIAKQIESDARLGADLMKKRVMVKKKKNIETDGPDDPAFLKWKKSNTTLKDMGAETLNEKDYVDEECPDNAIQVPVFRIGAGGQKFEKTHFYSEASAPTNVNGSEL
jgi:exonuclease VII small subunit